MKYYSHDGVDKWIAENLFLPDSGVYVDLGCAHPQKYSNTAFLRDRGWKGIAIDGDNSYAPEWEGVNGAIFINQVVSPSPIVGFLTEPTNSLVSRIHPLGKPTECQTLDRIIKVATVDRELSFLSIDIEGFEFDVLKATDLDLWKPTIIVAEYNSAHLGKDFRVFELLVGGSYSAEHMTDSNIVYLRKSC